MCNSSGSSRPLLRAVRAQQCCGPQTGLFHHPQHRAVAHRPLRHSPGAAAMLTLLGKKTCFQADFAFLPWQTRNNPSDSSSAERCSQRMLKLLLLLLCCCVPSGAAHRHMHSSALLFPSQGMISYLCQTHTHITGSQNSGVKTGGTGGYSSDSSNEPVPASVMQTRLQGPETALRTSHLWWSYNCFS